jgi:hypothetical protein
MECYAEPYISDLERTVYWCKSEDSFYKALNRLATEGEDFISDLRKMNTDDFIKNYVLYRDDGKCVHRVAEFLQTI